MPEPLAETARLQRVLRAQIALHNFRAALLALLTAIVAAGLWFVLRAIAHWLVLLASSVLRGVDARPVADLDSVFWTAAAGLIALAWFERRLNPDERPKDHKTALEITWDFVLAVPRLTLSIWGTLRAWLRLDDQEIANAVALIERLEDEPRLFLSQLPLEIPDSERRFRILFALQLLQIVDIRREDRELCVRLNPLRPPALLPRGASGTPVHPS